MKNKHPPTNLTGFLNRIYERSTEVGALKKRLAAQQVELESTRAQNAQLLDALTAAAYDLEEDIVKYSSQQTSLENLTSSNKSLQSSLESVQVELAKEKSDSESYRLRVTELESSLGTLKTNLDHSSADYELRIQGLEKQLETDNTILRLRNKRISDLTYEIHSHLFDYFKEMAKQLLGNEAFMIIDTKDIIDYASPAAIDLFKHHGKIIVDKSGKKVQEKPEVEGKRYWHFIEDASEIEKVKIARREILAGLKNGEAREVEIKDVYIKFPDSPIIINPGADVKIESPQLAGNNVKEVYKPSKVKKKETNKIKMNVAVFTCVGKDQEENGAYLGSLILFEKHAWSRLNARAKRRVSNTIREMNKLFSKWGKDGYHIDPEEK